MLKVERRSLICVLLAMVLFFGLMYYVLKLSLNGEEWATFEGNMLVYTNGQINRGSVYDRNDVLLLDCNEEGITFNENAKIRQALVHTSGDIYGNVSTGILSSNKGALIGYDFINGVYTRDNEGEDIKLTLDANACKVAYEALGYHNGTVGVFNYETGEVLCIVNKPAFDPIYLNNVEGAYFNTFLQGTVVPGSTFKVVTTIAAIENIENIEEFNYNCDGNSDINCSYNHGNVDFYLAFAKSCNGAYGEITNELGASMMTDYVKKLGLTNSYNIEGINTKEGEFLFSENENALAWAGIGQNMDRVNPCSMMILMGAIANKGEAVNPFFIYNSEKIFNSQNQSLGQMLNKDTAKEVEAMLKNNVVVTYGESNFDELDIYAKSGTAEVDNQNLSNGLFTGYIKNEGYPYAFFVFVENGGSGSSSAGSVAKKVLNELIN
ncbi:MAG TPA: penicillin-binding transpeptidase domain-containing protein [Anaerovoracaceae bacterium]|nr:penicillin-binding transpeptidase domain-containing protein [Anaerovoracaceae bacterium]